MEVDVEQSAVSLLNRGSDNFVAESDAEFALNKFMADDYRLKCLFAKIYRKFNAQCCL